MVLSCSQEPVWSGHSNYLSPETVSEYVLVSNPKKIEMATSSVYGTLPRVPKMHRRQMSEASIPAKYMTDPSKTTATKERKKSFFAGLRNKIKYAVDGKPTHNTLHRGLHWSPSDGLAGSTRSLYREYSPIPEHKTLERPQRLWTKGLENTYSSQRRIPMWRKSSIKKAPQKDTISVDFASCTSSDCSTPTSSAPSSPESQRSFLSSNAKRARRSGYSNVKLQDNTSNRDSLGSLSPPEEPKKSRGNKILVVGAEEVGKSALTVRFLTKRFIGEYAPEIESVYDQTINVEGKEMNVHIWDSAIPDMHQNSNDEDSDASTISHSSSQMSVTSSGESTSCNLTNRLSSSSLEDESVATNNNNNNGLSRKNKLRHTISKTIRRFKSAEGSDTDDDVMTSSTHVISEAERRLKWADGIVVVYSICDQSSFEAARDVIRYIRQTEAAEICRQGSKADFSACRIPILLIGNKLDLAHRRRVNPNDAQKLANAYACSFTELSVSERYEPVSEALKEHLKIVKRAAKHRDNLKSKSRKNRW